MKSMLFIWITSYAFWFTALIKLHYEVGFYIYIILQLYWKSLCCKIRICNMITRNSLIVFKTILSIKVSTQNKTLYYNKKVCSLYVHIPKRKTKTVGVCHWRQAKNCLVGREVFILTRLEVSAIRTTTITNKSYYRCIKFVSLFLFLILLQQCFITSEGVLFCIPDYLMNASSL